MGRFKFLTIPSIGYTILWGTKGITKGGEIYTNELFGENTTIEGFGSYKAGGLMLNITNKYIMLGSTLLPIQNTYIRNGGVNLPTS